MAAGLPLLAKFQSRLTTNPLTTNPRPQILMGVRHRDLSNGSVFSFTRGQEEREAEQALVGAGALIAHIANRVSVFWGLGLSDAVKDSWERNLGPELEELNKP